MPAADRFQRQHDAEQMRALLASEPWACFQRHLAAEIEDALLRVLDTQLPGVEADPARDCGIDDQVAA